MGPLTCRPAPQLTGDGISTLWEESGKVVYFTSLQEPFGAKGSKARQAFTKECYDRPRTLQDAQGAGEEAMYLKQ